MTATTPLVLMAARIFHRYCEAPCVAIAQRVGTEMRLRTVDHPSAGLAGFDHTDHSLGPRAERFADEAPG